MTDELQAKSKLSDIDSDTIDLVLIAPFSKEGRAEFENFCNEVVGPAVMRVENRTGRRVQTAFLNDFLYDDAIEHENIYRLLHLADIVIADVTSKNGKLDDKVLSAFSIRQALTPNPAIPVSRNNESADYPFNIASLVLSAFSENGKINAQTILYGEILSAVEGKPSRKYMSDVYASLSALRSDLRGAPNSEDQAPQYEKIGYRPRHNRPDVHPPSFEVAIGDLRLVKNIDVWINPENTHMEMARVFDSSISGIIRHMSAQWSNSGRRSDDYVRRKLAEEMTGEMVAPGAALMTSCKGRLREEHRVKKVVHVAAISVNGDDPGCGYVAVEDVGVCLTQALQKIQDYNLSWMGRGHNRLASVITPLLGVGSHPETASKNVHSMLNHAVQFFDSNPDCLIDRFVILAYSVEDKRLIKKALQRIPQLSNSLGVATPQTSTHLDNSIIGGS